MSDIVKNARRYDKTNTKRSDYPNPHNGELDQESDEKRIRFDCSGFVCHVIKESGYRIAYKNCSGLLTSPAFSTIYEDSVQAGDLIIFDGHVGIVVEYDTATYVGRFIHMSGKKNVGKIKVSDFKKPDTKNKIMKLNNDEGYGSHKPILAFRRVDPTRYSTELDLHPGDGYPFPVLRPLGTSLYGAQKRTPKPGKSVVAAKVRHVPKDKRVQTKPIPKKEGYLSLVKRMIGNFQDLRSRRHL